MTKELNAQNSGQKGFLTKTFQGVSNGFVNFFGSPWYQVPFYMTAAICSGAAFIDNTQYMQFIEALPLIGFANILFGSRRAAFGILLGMASVSAFGGDLVSLPILSDAAENIAAFRETSFSIYNDFPQPE
tara:strand:+ start:318 stop:707 length:390 start_codon:yes stop_codon:yes gene_type:complete